MKKMIAPSFAGLGICLLTVCFGNIKMVELHSFKVPPSIHIIDNTAGILQAILIDPTANRDGGVQTLPPPIHIG